MGKQATVYVMHDPLLHIMERKEKTQIESFLAVARFVEEHTRALAQPLKDLDIRKCSSSLSALANEKQRAQRDAGKKKKPQGGNKPALAGARQAASRDLEAYDEALDDQDIDFM